MHKTLERILKKFGTPVVHKRDGVSTTVYGFIQTTTTSAKKYFLPDYSPLGELPKGYCVMMLPLEPEMMPEDILVQGNRRYIVRRVEQVWLMQKAIYCRCLCEEEGRGDGWGD